MFMMDMHGSFAFATPSSSSRTPLERYCGSCMASTTRSYPASLIALGTSALSFPGSLRESTSRGPSRPFTGSRTRVPSLLMSSASAGTQMSFASWPAANSFVASRDPYEAPKIKMLWAMGVSTM